MARRIETQTSQTAEMTCASRAASFWESDPHYHSDDWVAPRLLPSFLQVLLRVGFGRKLFMRLAAPQGIYEYVIARTKYIDEVFQQALKDGFAQVLILGAGFDSRAVRFTEETGKTRIFELDALITQQAKFGQYQRRGIAIPPNLVFIPIDFEKQTLRRRLAEVGFQKGSKSLFLLEGLTMYLEPESADQTFAVICEYAGSGSRIVFDYAIAAVLRGEGQYYGAEIYKSTSQAGEQWRFGIEPEQVPAFLYRYGFNLLEHQTPAELEQRYFKDDAGEILGHINGTQCIVLGEKASLQ